MSSNPASPTVIQGLAQLINHNLLQQPPLLSVAIFYETCQSEPALYLCYETVENALARFAKMSTPEFLTTQNDRYQQAIATDRDFLPKEVLRNQLGPIFDPSYWANPADPVLYGVDSIVDQWVKSAFDAIANAIQAGESSTQVRADLRSGLWNALDAARRTYPGNWPPVSFVKSVDDYMENILTYMVTRNDDGS